MPYRDKESIERDKRFNEQLGKLVREIRLQRNQTQVEMADFLGIPQTVLSRIEQGHREMGARAWLFLMWPVYTQYEASRNTKEIESRTNEKVVNLLGNFSRQTHEINKKKKAPSQNPEPSEKSDDFDYFLESHFKDLFNKFESALKQPEKDRKDS